MNTSTKEKVLNILLKSGKTHVSGEDMAKELGVSRTYIWKAIKQLREDGFTISSKTNAGYILESCDTLSASVISESAPLFKVIVKDVTGSTNDDLKEMAAAGEKENVLLAARRQTSGKGRLGRSFYSPKDTGIYFSLLLHPSMSMQDSLILTPTAAVACAHAIKKHTGNEALIKWVNDIFVSNKKVCGILTEAAFDMELQRPSYVIIGIGINLSTEDFPEDIKDIAGNAGKADKNALIADIANEISALKKDEVIREYRRLSCVIGKQVDVPAKGITAYVKDINDDCNLVLETQDGSEMTLLSGEISIKMR